LALEDEEAFGVDVLFAVELPADEDSDVVGPLPPL
jgi:hypothetical protein